ncbi:MAG: MotA/TolQ/ExbB proton channel family protein [Silvanigrellales bacterium]|jgi:biopolymer transport protein ExbB/TolQ|nr:MotA/TolQ/ExbB proton channel family protein [Silvanigrellales bacterium]
MGITEQFLKFALLGAEWVMVVLILCSLLSLSIIIERIVAFSRIGGDFGEFVKGLTERLNSGESQEKVAAWCSGQKLLEASVAAVGLERSGDSLRSIEESMNATMISARTRLDRGLTILGTLGNNTPFIGLFGTIIGIIQAFNALATTKAAGPEVVMASISEALVATAVGLMVAIPAVVAYNFLGRVIKKKMANSETTARIIMTYFGRSRVE